MRLVVAEKPSVAMAISKVLGADTRREGYYEGNGWLVSWCIGHLIELADPDAYGDTYSMSWLTLMRAGTHIPFGNMKTCQSCQRSGSTAYRSPQRNNLVS